MENMAYQWLREWVEDGALWPGNSGDGVWSLNMGDGRLNSCSVWGFRDDMRQLLADAEAGRKLREGV